MGKQKINTTPFWRFLFLVYCGVMLWLLFDRTHGWNSGLPYKEILRQNANLTPFYTIGNYIHVLQTSQDRYMVTHCFLNLGGNVLLFIPAGWLLPKLWQNMRKFFCFFAVCAGAIFLVEILQLFTLLGRFDIDDWILNISGMILGYLAYMIFRRK